MNELVTSTTCSRVTRANINFAKIICIEIKKFHRQNRETFFQKYNLIACLGQIFLYKHRLSEIYLISQNYILYFTISKRRTISVEQIGKHMSVGVRRPRVSLRYHRGPVTALEAQQPFGCTTISMRCEFLLFTSSTIDRVIRLE